jgi:hypothetical protein
MSEVSYADAASITEPNGDAITLDSLPGSNTTRWVTSRKSQLIAAIHDGILTIEEASSRYRLTLDELTEWQTAFERHGPKGLKATLVQQFRHIRRA